MTAGVSLLKNLNSPPFAPFSSIKYPFINSGRGLGWFFYPQMFFGPSPITKFTAHSCFGINLNQSGFFKERIRAFLFCPPNNSWPFSFKLTPPFIKKPHVILKIKVNTISPPQEEPLVQSWPPSSSNPCPRWVKFTKVRNFLKIDLAQEPGLLVGLQKKGLAPKRQF